MGLKDGEKEGKEEGDRRVEMRREREGGDAGDGDDRKGQVRGTGGGKKPHK